MASGRKVFRKWVELVKSDIEKLRNVTVFLKTFIEKVKSLDRYDVARLVAFAGGYLALAIIFLVPVLIGAVLSATTGNVLFLNVGVVLFLLWFWLIHRLLEAWLEEDD